MCHETVKSALRDVKRGPKTSLVSGFEDVLKCGGAANTRLNPLESDVSFQKKNKDLN